jgi:hypothetical protein
MVFSGLFWRSKLFSGFDFTSSTSIVTRHFDHAYAHSVLRFLEIWEAPSLTSYEGSEAQWQALLAGVCGCSTAFPGKPFLGRASFAHKP